MKNNSFNGYIVVWPWVKDRDGGSGFSAFSNEILCTKKEAKKLRNVYKGTVFYNKMRIAKVKVYEINKNSK